MKKCDGNERKNVAKRANRGGEKKEGKEQKGDKRREKRGKKRERENSLRVEFPLCSLICQPMPFVFQPRTSRWK